MSLDNEIPQEVKANTIITLNCQGQQFKTHLCLNLLNLGFFKSWAKSSVGSKKEIFMDHTIQEIQAYFKYVRNIPSSFMGEAKPTIEFIRYLDKEYDNEKPDEEYLGKLMPSGYEYTSSYKYDFRVGIANSEISYNTLLPSAIAVPTGIVSATGTSGIPTGSTGASS